MQHAITDDLDTLLTALPPRIATAVTAHPQRAELIEIVMDLGRPPEARFPGGEVILADESITETDLSYVTDHIDDFGEDNRAGIERTLHRISAIRNRRGKVIGLTCRVGRAVYGTVTLIRDVVEQGRSLLILGRPGVGKTTMLREVARVLADDLGKRVVIVDTSNEIAGDGDVPHPGIGRARRMQVARPAEQHAVMIEAVENHMPQVIIIDEIGTELEAQAARTIAERGVQLVGTAHGNTLDNLLLNPTLSDLVGGISSVTLGDEEARRRGTQKTVLERKAPPTFDVVVEQQDRQRILVHPDVGSAVDALLRGDTPTAEARVIEGGTVRRSTVAVESQRPELSAHNDTMGGGRDRGRSAPRSSARPIGEVRQGLPPVIPNGRLVALPTSSEETPVTSVPMVKPRHSDGIYRVFGFGLSHDRIEEVAHENNIAVRIVDDVRDADVAITHRNIYRRQGDKLRTPEAAQIPIFVLRNPGVKQIREAFAQMLGVEQPVIEEPEPVAIAAAAPRAEGSRRQPRGAGEEQDLAQALQEAEDAIHYVLHRKGIGDVELSPQGPRIRRAQHLLATRYNLASRSFGKEPNRRVRIFSA